MGTSNKENLSQPAYFVGVGASAGGLEAIEQFFQNIPDDSGMAFIVIQHLSPDYKSMMVELLSKKTQLRVLRAEEGMAVERDTIYLIPPKKNLTIFHGKLLLSDQPPHERWINLPIDIFFRSLAEDQGEKAIGIILSGTGSDGSRGVRAIKEYGGIIMVQDEKDARFDGMPKSAASTGIADFVLKANEMPEKLVGYIKHPFLTKNQINEKIVHEEEGLTAVFSMLRSKTKVDFTHYKPSTVIRRIERRMGVNQLDDLEMYIRLLRSNSRELITLYHELLIGVTSFFRDKEAFDHLSEDILPQLLERKKDEDIRFWVVGCSTGEEAYSLAIILQEILEKTGKKANIKIFATDVDSDAVMVAGSGIYPESIAADVGSSLLLKYFQRQGDNYIISRKIREMVVFAQHNLLRDPPFTNIDLVSCRNLLIYLQPVLQQKALEMFNFSLNPGNILFLGSSETTGEMSSYFTVMHHRWKIYQSKGKHRVLAGNIENKDNYVRQPPTKVTDPADSNYYTAKSNSAGKQLCEKLVKSLAGDVIPLTVVVNEDLEIVYSIGDTKEYFRIPTGRMENDIRKMVRKEVSIPLTIGIPKVLKTDEEIRYTNIRFHGEKGSKLIHLDIKPLLPNKTQPRLIAVVLKEASKKDGESGEIEKNTYDYDKETEQRIIDMEQELQFTKENLQATIEELETSNEELQATNEELLASNEELQSTNEELQSVNEELYTVNSEHQRKIMELTELNNDIDNLLNSTEIGTVFLDEKLHVRKFTPLSQSVFNIIDSDLGRPFHHITNKLVDLDINKAIQKVMDNSTMTDFKVKTKDNNWYFIRILPYNVAPQIFAGTVITLIEISDLVDVENALITSKARLNLAEKIADFASWQWNVETGVIEFNKNLAKLHGVDQHKLANTYDALLEIIHPDDRSMFKEHVEKAVGEGRDYEIHHRVVWPDNTIHTLKQIAVATVGENGKTEKMTGVSVDVTASLSNDGEVSAPSLQSKSGDGLIIIDEFGKIESINSEIEEIFGYSATELIGKNVNVLMPDPHRLRHNEYIEQYLKTNVAKIIGKGREITAQSKNGSKIELFLAVGEIKIGDRSLFSGVLRRRN